MKINLITVGIAGTGILILILAAASIIVKTGNEGGNTQNGITGEKQYVCSMHPQVIRNGPGDCPICGMFLIEMPEKDGNSYDSTLSDVVKPVNNSVLASVKTVMPEYVSKPVTIEAYGIINYDPRKVSTISARFRGVVENCFVKYQFQHIKKGQKIFEIYCPDIYTEQWNYVKLVQAYPDRADLTVEALEWLRLQGLSEGQIDTLKHSPNPDYHLAVYSPGEGYAVSRDFNPESFFNSGLSEDVDSEPLLTDNGSISFNKGMTIEKGTTLFKLIDINALRADLKVKTEDASLLKQGQEVFITEIANPGNRYRAFVNQVEPFNGNLFQTVRAFISGDNLLLQPGQQVRAIITAGKREGLWIPVTAVADAGRCRSVFIMKDNMFVATEVKTGIRSGQSIEILEGIEPETEIAEKALMLTDSDGSISFEP